MPLRSVAAVLVLWALAGHARADTRAWLDRDRIARDETATLNIETDQPAATPDYAPLQRDFSLSGHTSSRRFETINGRSRVRALYAVALRPRRDGVLPIPSLSVGAQRTGALALTVSPGAAATPARAGAVVFVETETDDPDPYVQQAVGLVVRLYYAVPLLSGQLDQPPPDGAALQRVGQDAQYSRQLAGKRYDVLERRFLLIPERSGPLDLPGARFTGQGVGGFFDDLFGDGRRPLEASAPPRRLIVRGIPPGAPQPWLPLRDLRLRYLAVPQRVRAGEAATVAVEAVADGATAAQMPELQLDVAPGAQVLPEPVQADERFIDGRPQVTLTRRFSIVPAQAGRLRIQGVRLPWWDVGAGAARAATLPDFVLQVAPGAGPFAAPAGAPAVPAMANGDDGRISVPGVKGRILPWAAATVVFALLWFVTLLWGLRERAPAAAPPEPAPLRPDARATTAHLRRLLQAGDLGEIADTLRALAPGTDTLDALGERLDDPVQREALELLQRARWAGGDAAAARAALRAAFRDGPRWRAPDRSPAGPLPPLYPPA